MNENGTNQLKIYSLEASDSNWNAGCSRCWLGIPLDILSVAGKVYVAYTDASGYLCVCCRSLQKMCSRYTALRQQSISLRMELLYEQDNLWTEQKNTLELINVWRPDGSLPPLTVSGPTSPELNISL